MGFESPKFETKIETEPKPEPERVRTFESWQKLTVGEVSEQTVSLENLDNEQYKDLLYKTVEDRLGKTADVLGIRVDNDLIEELNQVEDNKERAEIQKEIIKSLAKQINSIPSGKWAFYPGEIEREKKINCSGAALICGNMLNKIGIKTEYGSPAHHAVNFAELADGSVLYVDSRNNMVIKIRREEEKFKKLKIRMVNDRNIEYRIVPSLSQKDAIVAILGNIEALKTEAKKEDSNDLIAKEIYEKGKKIFDSADYFKLSKELYPDLNEFRSKNEWQEEEKRIIKLHNFNSNLDKIKERYKELNPKEREKLKTEANKEREFLRAFLLSDVDIEDKISRSLFGLFSDIKKELAPLKNWDNEEYEKFIENLLNSI